MVSANSRSFSEDQGRKFENMVFLHFRRKYQEIYYFFEVQECDFVVCDRSGLIELVQACVELNSDNQNRELGGLWEAMKFFDKKEALMVTIAQEDEFQEEERKIFVIPFYKLML